MRQRVKVGAHQPQGLVECRIRRALGEDVLAELHRHGVDESLHHRALGTEVVGGQAAAVAGALSDVGQCYAGWPDLADQLGGGGA